MLPVSSRLAKKFLVSKVSDLYLNVIQWYS